MDSHAQAMYGLTPEALSLSGLCISSVYLQLFTALTFSQRCHSRISCCRQVASSSSQTSVVGSGSREPSVSGRNWQPMAPEAWEERPQTLFVVVWVAGGSFQALFGRPFVVRALEQGPTGLSATDVGSHRRGARTFSTLHHWGIATSWRTAADTLISWVWGFLQHL